jgi:hypothetical protein
MTSVLFGARPLDVASFVAAPLVLFARPSSLDP